MGLENIIKMKIGEVSCSHGRFHGMVKSCRLTQPTAHQHFPISDAHRDSPAQTNNKILLLLILINKPNPNYTDSYFNLENDKDCMSLPCKYRLGIRLVLESKLPQHPDPDIIIVPTISKLKSFLINKVYIYKSLQDD